MKTNKCHPSNQFKQWPKITLQFANEMNDTLFEFTGIKLQAIVIGSPSKYEYISEANKKQWAKQLQTQYTNKNQFQLSNI